MPNSISHGEPRVARWHRLMVNVSDMKLAVDSAGEKFQWPIQDAVIYIPPRLPELGATTHYSDRWKQSMLPRNENAIGESKGTVEDDIKSKPGLKDVEECSGTRDLATVALVLEARICRLEEMFAEEKQKRLSNKLENQFKGRSSERN